MIFFQNNDDLKIFKKLNIIKKNNYDIIPGSGVNLDYFSCSNTNIKKNINFLFIGRLIKAKGMICDWSEQDMQSNWLKKLGIEGSLVYPLGLFNYEDKPLKHLKRAKKLDKLAGLIVGSMNDMHDNNVPYGETANEIIYNAVKEFNYPVCFNFPSGHIENNNSLMLGLKANLKMYLILCLHTELDLTDIWHKLIKNYHYCLQNFQTMY